METQTALPIVHNYTEINHGKFASERHYKLNHVVNGISVFTEFIKISQDRKSEKPKPFYCLEIREGKKWKSPAVTGLFVTNFPGIFKDDNRYKKNLIIVKFDNDKSQVLIYYFKNFYTRDLKALIGSTVS